MYGSTGDVTPWHGYPICPDSLPDCYIDDNSEEVKVSFRIFPVMSQFLEYVRFTNLVFYTEYQPTQPRIHLILNGGGALDDWNWENIPEHWLKRGMASHGYQLNTERETEEKYMAQVILIRSLTVYRREGTWMDTRYGFEERTLTTRQRMVGVNL